MRKITYAFAFLMALLSGTQLAKADTVSPYSVDFNEKFSTSDPEFKVATGWGHKASTYYDDEEYDYLYPTYSSFINGGVDNSGCLKIGKQTGLGSSWGSGETTTDLLITPAVSGTVTLAVKKYVNSSTIKFYNMTKNGANYLQGSEITVDLSAINTSDYTTVTIPVEDNTYIGIWGNNIYIDDFAATSAEVELTKALTITSAKNIGGTDAYCDENNEFTITFQATVKNSGDIALTPGDAGYSLSIINNTKDNVVVGTKLLTEGLAVGKSLTDTISVKVSADQYPDRNRYDLMENISGSIYKVYAWMDIIPYKPILQLRNSNGNIDSLSTFDYGKVNTATSKSFTIRNKGGKALNVTNIAVPDGFSIDLATPFAVAAGEDTVFTVTLQAETAGSYSGDMVITADEVSPFKVSLKGIVLDPSKWYVTFEDQKIPAGTIAEENWAVKQINYQSSANAYALAHGITSTENKFITPLMKIEEGETMTFEVGPCSKYAYNNSCSLNIYYSTDRQNWTLAKAVALSDMTTEASGYGSYAKATEFTLSEIPAGNYYIAFGGKYVYIDNLYGFEVVDVAHDWAIASTKLPDAGTVNRAYTATASLKNVNTKAETAGSYTATLYVGETAVEGEAVEIAAGESADYSFSFTPHEVGTYPAYVVFENAADGYKVVSDTAEVTISQETVSSEIQIGSSSSTGYSYPVPIRPYYNHSKSDAVYSAEMLAAAGLKAGDVITKISYKGYHNQTYKGPFAVELKSWIASTDLETFSGTTYAEADTTAMAVIYDDTYTIPLAGSASEHAALIEIELATPYVYDGKGIRIYTKHDNVTSYASINFEYNNDKNHCYSTSWDYSTVGTMSANYLPVPYFSVAKTAPTFSGKVMDADSVAIAGAKVKLTNGDVYYTATTAEDGSYSMEVIQSEKPYLLTAEAEDYDPFVAADSLLVDSVPTKDIVLSLTPSTITLTEGEWATFSAKEPIDFAQTDINAYIVTAVSGENATLKRVEKVPARTGVLLYGNGTYTLPTATETEAVDGNLLVATADGAYTVETEAVGKAYTFANNYFSKAAVGDVVAKKHAYLNAEGAADAVYLVLPKVTFSGTVTDGTKAISGVTVAITDKNGEVLTVTTDAEGKFAQTVDQTNFKYVVTAEALGYDGYESDSIVALTDTVLAIVLDRQPIVASISTLGWTSFSSIFPVDLTESGLTAYIVTAYADGKATVVAAGSKVPANTGVLLKGEAGDYTLDVAEEAAALEGNILGNTAAAPLEITSDNYGKVYSFAEVDNAPGFFKDEAGYTIPLGEAYLPVSGGADEFYALYDPTTGITFTVEGCQLDESQPMYNLAGQRVAKSFRGVVVQNGKKFVRK